MKRELVEYIEKTISDIKYKSNKRSRGESFYEELGWTGTGKILALKKVLKKIEEIDANSTHNKSS